MPAKDSVSGLPFWMRTVAAPKKYWKAYCAAIERPIVTIMSCVRLMRFRRSGRQIAASCR